MHFTIHTGLKVSPFELHHGRKPRTELTNIIKRNKSYPSDWTTLNLSVPPKQVPIYVARNERRSDGSYDYGQQEENPMLRITPIVKKKAGWAG